MTGDKRKVFGIGWPKTGTTTLGHCLEILGYSHVGCRLDLVDHLPSGDLAPILDVARAYDSAEDWPWLLLYRELDAAFPGSRFVLTQRDPEALTRSYRNMVAAQVRDATLDRRREVLYGFAPLEASDEQLVARVKGHNAAARAYFADRPGDLLEVDWSRGDGWAELCGFLGHSIPEVPFPRANAGDYKTPAWRRRLVERGRPLMRRLAATKLLSWPLGRRS
ncbi:hypothetical protein ISU10_22250 [Nocardioides agariphilus]|uniref:Sulfotransferase family protein n=1 Tax=Nocardioides agariphilus TaxID=433664 RepID=A0A930YPQ5_9ACTN|nr:sulfotransferase family protein [Nocardioides agariphilus]MBF4770504.1 hypothetical protein [Nocardioides agariphilus]